MPKSKVKEIKKKLSTDDISDIFNSVFGEGNIDTTIVEPKYDNIISNLDAIKKITAYVFGDNLTSPYMKDNFNIGVNEFLLFCKRIDNFINAHTLVSTLNRLSKNEIDNLNNDPALMDEYLSRVSEKYDRDELQTVYRNIKNSEIITNLIFIYRNIEQSLRYTMSGGVHNLEDPDNLKSYFVTRGPYPQLFEQVSCLNFQLLFMDNNIKEKYKIVLLKYIKKVYGYISEIYCAVTTPDIDITKFSDKLLNAISELKKHPKLKGCEKAFQKISQSVSMLEDKFDNYYKHSVASKNPNMILEMFFEDIISDSNESIVIISQLKKILNFYRDVARTQNNTQVSDIINNISDKINIMRE